MLKALLLVFFWAVFVECHPTMYRMNGNVLAPDLVPISSTVIPLPVYKVSYGIDVKSPYKDDKIKKPDGPIYLETVYTKKKLVPVPKAKPSSQVWSVKEVSKVEFEY